MGWKPTNTLLGSALDLDSTAAVMNDAEREEKSPAIFSPHTSVYLCVCSYMRTFLFFSFHLGEGKAEGQAGDVRHPAGGQLAEDAEPGDAAPRPARAIQGKDWDCDNLTHPKSITRTAVTFLFYRTIT